MERCALLSAARVNVSKSEHVLEAIFAPRLVTTSGFENVGILECAKKKVPKGKVGKIACMVAKLMMDPMRFWALKDESKPWRRPNIPVIEKFTDGDEDRVVTCRAKAAAK
jgi:hypothetical protein